MAACRRLSSDENCYEITTEPSDFSAVREALEEANLICQAEVQMIPTTYVSLNGRRWRKNAKTNR